MAEDYFKVLGVTPTASKAEIKQAYHRLAKEYHPDRNVGDPEAERKFQAISEAYKFVSDGAQVYYTVLGVSRSTPMADIKRAYARICERLHPAIRNGDAEAMRKLERAKQAYDYLAGQEDELGSDDNDW